ncbi:Spy/CpxP family protein refolding chaperone [Marinobacter sp. CHS3-4]|uniref:Spy/CpxP family protein refolding chaperone n=1 Tax=Marinobacter sp. CHS3-4 TaxID=3045174 RepID=UPI0024B609DF|nr:Spy/CpxP family protein refolding chaperone [Marinobacter sp. CHS3-4]MDI9245320.1 Spy/CpxP family protein refolding chaperone [Marinobacter sp. CHS3-4]
MKLQKYFRNRLPMAFCLGLTTAAFMAHAHEVPSSSGSDTSQSADGKTPGMQHQYHHGNGYQGHHGMHGQDGMHHGMQGQNGMHHGAHGSGAMVGGPLVELGLDDEQLTEIAGIQKELRSELQELKVERYEESLKLQELYTLDELDADDINDQQQRVFDVIKEITELQVEAQQDIREVLTTEQRAKLLRAGGWLK